MATRNQSDTMNDPASWSPPQNAVLKLQIGSNSVRRIKIHLLLDDDGHLSYDRLVRWCIRYSPLFIAKKHEKKVGSSSLESVLRKWDVKVTYVDDEGDVVVFSTEDEFIDAFQQAEQAKLVTRPPVEIGNTALSAKNWMSNGSVSSTASSSQTGGTTKSMVVLKCLAEVHEKSSRDEHEEETAPTSEDASSAPPSVVEDADATMAPPKSSPSEAPTEDAAAAGGRDRRRRGAQPQVQALLESFVSILATAVMALQDHLAAVSANARAIDEIQSGRAKTCLRREQQQGAGGAVGDASGDQEKEEQVSSDDAPALQVAARLMKEAMKQKAAAEEKGEEKDEVPTASPNEGDEEKKEDGDASNHAVPAGFDPNFVHVRHTCDGCMQNPIVGIRYHATNIPDYDLCEGCKNNFTGKDILFEPEELERDRRFQFRARRHMRRGQRSMRGCPAGGRRPGFPGGLRGRRAHCAGGHHHHPHQDSEIKEAIRLSLIDVQSKGKATASEAEAPKAGASKVDDVATGCGAKEGVENSSVAPPEGERTEVPELVARAATSPAPAPAPAPPKSPLAQVQADEIEENVAKVVDAVGFTIEQCALVINAVVSEFVDGGSSKKGTQGVPVVAPPAQRASAPVSASDSKGASDASKGEDNVSCVTDPDFAGVEEQASEAISVEMTIEDDNADIQDNTKENAKVENEILQPASQNEGETEEAFFDTFATDGGDDKHADEESAGVEHEAFHPIVSEEETVDDASDVEVDAVEPEANVEHETSNVDVEEKMIAEEEEESLQVAEVALSGDDDGIRVIDSVVTEEDCVKPESPEDEWNIVDSGEHLDSQNLARAAEALGSALFQEDISRSAESLKANIVDVSDVEGSMSNSSSSISLSSSVSMVSSVSSVTSSVSSVESFVPVPTVSSGPVLSEDVLAKWGDLIDRLREMGFTDDVKSADVLETLRASGEDVTIDGAVTYLLKN